MINNDVFRTLRYAANIKDIQMIEIFKLGNYKMEQQVLENLYECRDHQ